MNLFTPMPMSAEEWNNGDLFSEGSLSIDKWYDVDGDGILEVENYSYFTYCSGIFKFDSSKKNCSSIFTLSNDYYVDFRFMDYNNDGFVDVGYSRRNNSGRKYEYVVNLGKSGGSFTDAINTFAKLYEVPNSAYDFDYNNDGVVEQIQYDFNEAKPSTQAFIFGKDFSVKPVNIAVMSPEEYAGEQVKVSLNSSYSDPLRFDNVVYDNGTTSNTSGYSYVDINSDGKIDFLNTANGNYFLCSGEDILISSTFGGAVTLRDFNNDGVADYVTFNSATKELKSYISQATGGHKETLLYSGFYFGANIWAYDVDHDNDVDLIVPMDAKVWYNGEKEYYQACNNDNCYLLVMENKGDGSFATHENYMGSKYWFFNLRDIDGDQNYEIIVGRGAEKDIVAYKLNGLTIDANPVKLFDWNVNIENYNTFVYRDIHPNLMADIDNSGHEYWITDNNISQIPGNKNQSPARPGKPEYIYDAATSNLTILWTSATDAETSSIDLTYAMRIGTAPDKSDIMSCDALNDGRRRNLSQGNCGYSLKRTLNVSSWDPGKYYISVQAIDPNCHGSQFSEYLVFEKTAPSGRFTISSIANPAVGDTCTVELSGKVSSGYSYEWDFDGATIISQNADKSKTEIVYNTGGNKTISLKVLNSNDEILAKSERSHKVANIKFRENFFADYATALYALDIDNDGFEEIFADQGYTQLYGSTDNNGEYDPIYGLWQNFTLSDSDLLMDIDKDGDTDIVGFAGSWSTAYKWVAPVYNKGDETFESIPGAEYESGYTLGYDKDWKFGYPDIRIMDLNNDGAYDFTFDLRNLVAFVGNDTDSLTFNSDYIELLPMLEERPNDRYFVDYDHDGFIDIVEEHYKNEGAVHIYRNNGDFTFSLFSKINVEKPVIACSDIDCDGKPDIIMSDAYVSDLYGGIDTYSASIIILWGNGEKTTIPFENGQPWGTINKIYDFDNNGCLDIYVFQMRISDSSSDKTGSCIYFNKDHSYFVGVCPDVKIFDNNYPEFKSMSGQQMFGEYELFGSTNSKPLAPTAVRASQTEKFVTIEWNHSVDAETPENGMRYNLSVKRKGAEGTGAYIISPLNGGINGAALPSPFTYISSNKYSIPTEAIPAGTYEIKVQGLDLWHTVSDFSETLEFTVNESAAIEMPASTAVNKVETVKVNTNSTADIDFGEGATVHSQSGNTYNVSWASEGLKTVSMAGVAEQKVYVYPVVAGDFDLPASVMQGASVRIAAKNAFKGSWGVVENGQVNEDLAEFAAVDDNTVIAKFNKAGELTVCHSVADEYSSANYEHTVSVTNDVTTQEISLIDIDGASGKHTVNWAVPANMPAEVTGVNIYKEGSRLNDYKLLATVPVADCRYVDITSMPNVQASRYRLAYATNYGESAHSVAHQAIHLMINKAAGKGYNLLWSRYEGQDVQYYRILRGTSADALETIAEISGNMSSYTDTEAQGDILYYAVETITTTAKARSAAAECRSNVVSIVDAANIVAATGIYIKAEGDKNTINLVQNNTLQLSAYVLPATATIHSVNWLITSGSDIATISRQGLLTATKPGKVTVSAFTVDGSNLSAEFEVEVLGFVSEIIITAEDNRSVIDVSKDAYSLQLYANVLPEQAANRDVRWEIVSGSEYATIDDSGLLIVLGTGNGVVVVRAYAMDGSGVYGEYTVTITGHVVPVSEIKITSENGRSTIDLAYERTLQLYAEVLPEDATDKRVVWNVISGDNLASVDASGLVTANGSGNGMVMVEATAADGIYDISAVFTLNVIGCSGVADVLNDGKTLSATVSADNSEVYISGMEGKGVETELYIFDINGRILHMCKTADSNITIDCSRFARGIYYVKSVTETITNSTNFIKQ